MTRFVHNAPVLRDKLEKLTAVNVELRLRVERLERFPTDMENYFKRKCA